MLDLVVLALLQTAVAAPPSAASPVGEEKPVCRREVPTGSILPGKKVCHSKLEWSRIDAATAAYSANEMSRRLAVAGAAGAD